MSEMASCSRRVLLGGLIAMAAAGCSRTAVRPSAAATGTSMIVDRYASANPGSVNVFWLRTPRGLVVVDTGRTLSDARRALELIRKTGQPISAILITHSHPDHVGGIGVFHDAYPKAPILASHATAEIMRTDPLGFYPLTRKGLGGDYPARIVQPNRIFGPDEPVTIDGLLFQTAQFGPGESETATAYYEPTSRSLFPGDLVCNRATPALLEGHSCGWLNNLNLLERRFPSAKTCYSGHGSPADAGALIAAQRNYIQRLRQLVQQTTTPASPGGTRVTQTEQQAVLADLDRSYPRYPSVASIPDMPQRNIAAVATELTTAGASHCASCCGS